MWAIILQTSFVCCLTANAEQLLLHDQGLIQQGLDIAETMGVDTGLTWGRRRRRRRRNPTPPPPPPGRQECSWNQVCSVGCYTNKKGCTGDCKYRADPTDNSSAFYCGCSCAAADPSTVNLVEPVTATPKGMVLDKKKQIVPAFCIGKASDNLPFPPFLLKKMPAKLPEIALVTCWGPTYGTAIGLSGSIPGWSIVGNIYWPNSIYGANKACMFCGANPVDGKIMICRDITLGSISIRTAPMPGDFMTLKITIKGKLCLGFGIEAEPLDNSKTNLFIEPAAGLNFEAAYLGRKIAADIQMTGKISMKNFQWNPFGKFDGFSFRLGGWGALYFDGAKFTEVTIDITEEWAISVSGLANAASHAVKPAPVKNVEKGLTAQLWNRIMGNNRW